jgi:tetratricopeptide (TPR) repeat protein
LAIEDYDKIIELEPDSGAYHDRALAYMNLGKYVRAVDDFTKAIEVKKGKADYFYYENRAELYIKLGDYEEAIKDFDKAIQMNLDAFTILGNVSQFRMAYPEYNHLTNDALAKKLHRKVFPNLQYVDFAKMFLKENKGFFSSVVPELYVKRGDAYLNLGHYKKAIQEYNRVKAFPDYAKYFEEWERWRLFSTSAEGKHYFDIKTVTYPQKGNVTFWVKTTYEKLQQSEVAYSIENWEVSCSSRMIRGISFINYSSDGNIKNRGSGTKWENIVPDSIVEGLYRGWCRD